MPTVQEPLPSFQKPSTMKPSRPSSARTLPIVVLVVAGLGVAGAVAVTQPRRSPISEAPRQASVAPAPAESDIGPRPPQVWLPLAEAQPFSEWMATQTKDARRGRRASASSLKTRRN